MGVHVVGHVCESTPHGRQTGGTIPTIPTKLIQRFSAAWIVQADRMDPLGLLFIKSAAAFRFFAFRAGPEPGSLGLLACLRILIR